jgi:histidine triad (HIT) family protein
MSDCIFCKIAAGQIPSRKVYEDEQLFAFHDIQAVAPVHFLVIPKQHVDSLDACGPEHADVLSRLLLAIPKLARAQGLGEGYRTIINTGKGGGQTVFHLHAHVMGGGGPLPFGQAGSKSHA